MGVWWLYLVNHMSEQLRSVGGDVPNVVKIVLWEGTTFLILIVFLTMTLTYYYLRSIQRTKAVQAFFASLTHELKTPLASLKLQAEVLKEKCSGFNDQSIDVLFERMTEEANNLETQMDKILHLSMVERKAKLTPTNVNLDQKLSSLLEKYKSTLQVNVSNELKDSSILCDAIALELILKNLFENTKRHSKEKRADISITEKGPEVLLTYKDLSPFKGNTEKMGELFQKSKDSKGSGIGLYLIKKLMLAMNGRCEWDLQGPFQTKLFFQKVKGDLS